MIEECNFKEFVKLPILENDIGYDRCVIGTGCVGEDNCILFQIYKQLQPKGLTGFDRIKEDRF